MKVIVIKGSYANGQPFETRLLPDDVEAFLKNAGECTSDGSSLDVSTLTRDEIELDQPKSTIV